MVENMNYETPTVEITYFEDGGAKMAIGGSGIELPDHEWQ